MLRLSTRSNRSFSDKTVKYFSRMSSKSGQSTNTGIMLNCERKSAIFTDWLVVARHQIQMSQATNGHVETQRKDIAPQSCTL